MQPMSMNEDVSLDYEISSPEITNTEINFING